MNDKTNLLPLPPRVVIDKHLPTGVAIYGYTNGMMRDYARANVEHAVAPLQAEIEALRADAERYRWLRERMVAEEIVNKAYAAIALRVVGPIAKRPADPEYCGELDAVIDQARGGCGDGAALDAAQTDQQQAEGGQTNA